jgi:hypothetical protein
MQMNGTGPVLESRINTATIITGQGSAATTHFLFILRKLQNSPTMVRVAGIVGWWLRRGAGAEGMFETILQRVPPITNENENPGGDFRFASGRRRNAHQWLRDVL